MKAGLAALAAAILLSAAPCAAWSPGVHAAQAERAARLAPAGMSRFLERHWRDVAEALAGAADAAPPTPEAVEEQFRRVLDLSEAGAPPGEIARELGRLALMAQLLTDPSAAAGSAALRREMAAFADGHRGRLTAVREPLFAAGGDPSPRAAIAAWDRAKYERFRALRPHLDPKTGARVGAWDELSVPFAQMQLGFSAGVSATADIWAFAWRAAGGLWR